MTKTAVFEAISQEQGCNPEDISLDTRLDDLGVDSLRAITILYELEEQLHIEIPNELVETVQTVGDIVAGIDRLRSGSDSEWQET